MNKTRKKLLTELKKIAAHFRLTLSKIDIIRKSAIAIDVSNKKLLVINENDHPFFKTIDLDNVDACALKVDYSNINAGELQERDMEEFVEKIQFQIKHVDPRKSVNIPFYNKRQNTIHELRTLVNKATGWRDKITSMLPKRMVVRAQLKPIYHEQQ